MVGAGALSRSVCAATATGSTSPLVSSYEGLKSSSHQRTAVRKPLKMHKLVASRGVRADAPPPGWKSPAAHTVTLEEVATDSAKPISESSAPASPPKKRNENTCDEARHALTLEEVATDSAMPISVASAPASPPKKRNENIRDEARRQCANNSPTTFSAKYVPFAPGKGN